MLRSESGDDTPILLYCVSSWFDPRVVRHPGVSYKKFLSWSLITCDRNGIFDKGCSGGVWVHEVCVTTVEEVVRHLEEDQTGPTIGPEDTQPVGAVP